MGLCRAIWRRIRFGKQLYLWGWGWVVFVIWGLPYGIVGIYDTAIGQGFLSSNYPKLATLIPDWLPTIWFVLGVIAIVLVTFEGAYRITHKQAQSTELDYALVWYEEEWRLRTPNGWQNYWDDESMGIGLQLIGWIAINIKDQIRVESIELDIGSRVFKSDWESQEFYISEEREVKFDIPLDIKRGKRTATIRAIVDGQQYSPKPVILNVPQWKQVFHKEGSQI